MEDFLAYIQGAELIIHNAPFDVGFLNHEFRLLGHLEDKGINAYCEVLDTLVLAKKKHPGQRNSLDALCKRYRVDNSHRDLHGALLDAEILAEVYLLMTGGQTLLSLEFESTETQSKAHAKQNRSALQNRPKLKVIYCSETERMDHQARLQAIDKASRGKCLWQMEES